MSEIEVKSKMPSDIEREGKFYCRIGQNEKIKLLGNKIIVRRLEPREKTSGGLFVPDIAKHEKAVGTVLAIGPGDKNKKGRLKPVELKPGDVIIFDPDAFVDIEYQGEPCVMTREDNVLGVVEL